MVNFCDEFHMFLLVFRLFGLFAVIALVIAYYLLFIFEYLAWFFCYSEIVYRLCGSGLGGQGFAVFVIWFIGKVSQR